MASNVIELLSNVIEMASNAIELLPNVIEMVSNAIELLSNVIEMLCNGSHQQAVWVCSSNCVTGSSE